MLTDENRALRGARLGALRQNRAGRRAFVQHFDAKARSLSLQPVREQVRIVQFDALGESKAAAGDLEHRQAQGFELFDELAHSACGET